jgi:hypothetical protein
MKQKNGIHYFEVKDLVTQFVSAFDSIIIGRFKGKTKESELRVRYVYAPKEKVLHDLVNRAQHITVPAISVHITGIARDKDRVESKNLGHFINGGSKISHEVPQPIPVNISVKMSVITRYQDDMDQILANFIPYNNPYIIISWKLPDEFAPSIGVELRSEVLWDGSVSITQPIEMGEGLKYRNVADTTFLIKGWLFKKHPENPTGNIFEIDTTYYPIKTFSDVFSDDLTDFDEFSLSAYPLITITVNRRVINGEFATIRLEGQNFDFTSSVYLSSDNSNIFSDSLSSFGDFEGIKLSEDNYTINGSSSMFIQTDKLNDVGHINVIVQNPAGFVVSDQIEVINI